MSLPITFLEKTLHKEGYHNPDDLREIDRLKKQLKKATDTLENLVKDKDDEKTKKTRKSRQKQVSSE